MTRRLLALILAWPVTGLMAQASPQPDFSKVKETIQQWVNKHYYTGASLWVAQDGNLLCEAYFGDAKPCLLYTSPSPRDRQKSRMPSSA